MDLLTDAGRTLEAVHFDNSFARLPAAFYERRMPTGLPNPRLLAFSADAGALIDLPPGAELGADFLQWASGNALLPGMEPIAAIYAGHQFGTFVAQLGDGRAILLGEVDAAGGRWELQLKGGGPTAFSRFADGRAVLRSTIREYLCSEAMHHLGIPTTRALSITGSDEPVYRETVETAAVLVRMAPTFVRFGSFELFASRRQTAEVQLLADYVIDRHFALGASGSERYAQFFTEVVRRTAELMAAWQSVGFAHGVMNTDNFSIVGLNARLRPLRFSGRLRARFYLQSYRCRRPLRLRPAAFDWTLELLRAGEHDAVARLENELETALGTYEHAYRLAYDARMRAKLGLHGIEAADAEIVHDLLTLLSAAQADYTRSFAPCAMSRLQARRLTTGSPNSLPIATAGMRGRRVTGPA